MGRKSRNTLRRQELTGEFVWFQINGEEARLTGLPVAWGILDHHLARTLSNYIWVFARSVSTGAVLTSTLGFRMCEKWMLSTFLVCSCCCNKLFHIQWLKSQASLTQQWKILGALTWLIRANTSWEMPTSFLELHRGSFGLLQALLCEGSRTRGTDASSCVRA